MHRLPLFVLLVAVALSPRPVRAGGDTTPPTVTAARVIYDPANPLETALLEFEFSETVDWFQAILYSNYIDTASGETSFQGFWYPPNRTQVRFTDQFFDYGTCYEIRVINVRDEAGNVIVDDGIGNVFRFHLQQVLVRGNMRDHMKSHDVPPHEFAVEGVRPGSFPAVPTCDMPLDDADADSVYTQFVFFDVPCSTAVGGAETRDVEFRFSHQCSEPEPIPNRMLTLDLALNPDGRDTLDLDWADEVVTDVRVARPVTGSRLESVFPSPSSTGASVAFSLSAPARVALDVVDVQGRVVRRLEAELWPSGAHLVEWDGRADSGRSVAPGVYFVRFDAGHGPSARRVVVTR